MEKANVAVVQGIGPVGSFAVAYFASLGIKNIIALTVGKDERKEKLVRDLGATEVIDLKENSEDEIIKHINEISNSLGADVVFEASGNPKAVPMGMSLLRNRGVYLVPGQYSNSGGIEIQPQMITFKALHIIGSSQYSKLDVEKYIEFLEKNTKLHHTISSLATCYKVEDVNAAFNDAMAHRNIKTVLVKG
jgi:threonine dehydrogenase-like Zn-dependent dehydrogenase